MKKGEAYIQAIYYLAFQAQYALTDHWSIGAAAPIWAAPFLVNVKYTNVLSESADGKQNVYFATGVQAGSLSYIEPGTWLGVGYAGLTFGNPESNICINGGVLGLSYMDYDFGYDPNTQQYSYTEFRTNEARPAVSLSFNQRVSSTASVMGEVWYVGNKIVGGPGMRFYSGRKNAIDVAVLGVADKVIDAVKTGAIKHFFLIGGCDGAAPGRNYYTDLAEMTPPDTVVMTLGCGKYRFHEHDFGNIGGIPRLLDIGQCNDAYSAVKIASALAGAFECGVNDLPLSLMISWFEQKAVAVLLSLLSLGIRGIHLGPTLPAFLTPNLLAILVEKFDIRPNGEPANDLAMALKQAA
jgi:hypothetical protein